MKTSKTSIKSLFLLPAAVAGLSFLPAGRLTAQFPINFDGAHPNAGLLLAGDSLYGTTAAGGYFGYGTVFAINTNGLGFRILRSFTGGFDGASPWDGLILSGNTLYGTAYSGGSFGYGTAFAVNTDSTGFTVLHSFTSGSDGGNPIGGLMLSGNTLSGTTQRGGGSGNGTVFSLSFTPQLTIAASGTNAVLSWPTNYAGFDYSGYALQSATNLASPAAWVTNCPAPVVIAGQNTVTNPISGPQRFYRLIH